MPTKLPVCQHESALKENHQFVRNYRILDLYCNRLQSLDKFDTINFEFLEYLQLSCCQIGSSSIFRCLLRHCKRLKYLSIDTVKIGQDDDEGVIDDQIATRDLYFLKILNFNNNLDVPLTMLKAITCERLVPKVFDFQIFTIQRENDIRKFKEVLTYVHQHYAKSLKSLSIFNSCDEVLHVAMDLLRLPEFKLHKFMIHELKPEFRSEVFEEFLENQTELTHFEIADCMSEWHLQTLTRSLPNLTRLIMSVNTCGPFNRCGQRLDKIKNLKLKAVLQEDDLKLPKNLETFHLSSLINPFHKTRINFLLNAPMASLKTLILRDGYIETQEMKKFFKFCPNIEHLEMTGFGADFEVLAKSSDTIAECSLSNWKRLRSIKFEKEFLHDDILTLIESTNLKELVWMVSKQEHLTVSFEILILSL
jgi:hypothetical protein